MNNAVGYARPAAGPTRSCSAPTASAPTCSRSSASPTSALRAERRHRVARHGVGLAGRRLGARSPRPLDDRVTWSYEPDRARGTSPSRPASAPLEVVVDGETVLADGAPTRVDPVEVRARAAEQAARLHARL